MARRSEITKMSFREVFGNPPAGVKSRKQKVAIALSKARKRGARIPKKG